MVICPQRGADCLHMVQMMPLPSPKPHHLMPHLNRDWFYLSGTKLPGCSAKRPLNRCSSSNSSSDIIGFIVIFHISTSLNLPDLLFKVCLAFRVPYKITHSHKPL